MVGKQKTWLPDNDMKAFYGQNIEYAFIHVLWHRKFMYATYYVAYMNVLCNNPVSNDVRYKQKMPNITKGFLIQLLIKDVRYNRKMVDIKKMYRIC